MASRPVGLVQDSNFNFVESAVPELAALSALAAVGCGLAAAQGDLWFVTVFGAASVVTMIEVVRRLL